MRVTPVTAGFAIGWRQVASCVVLLGIVSLITSSYGVIAVPLGKEFNPSRMRLMLAMTVVSAVSAVISPTFGRMMDKISLRLAMTAGVGLLVIGFVAISFAQSFNQVLLFYGLLVAPANILIGPLAATVLLSRWFVNRRGTAMGIAIAGISLGTFMFSPILQFLLNMFEWREALRALAAIICIVALPAALLVVSHPRERGLFPDGAASDPQAEAAASKGGAVFSLAAILTDRTFWLLALVVATVTAGLKGMVTNLVPMATDVGITANAAALLISIYAASGFMSKLTFAATADRINPRRLLAISLIGYGVGTAAMAVAGSSYAALAVGVMLMGFFGGMMIPMESYLTPRIWGRAFVGRVGGLLNLALLSMLLITPPLFGWMHDVTGSYERIFLIFSGIAVVALMLVPLLRIPPRDADVAGQAASTS